MKVWEKLKTLDSVLENKSREDILKICKIFGACPNCIEHRYELTQQPIWEILCLGDGCDSDCLEKYLDMEVSNV